MNAYLQKYRKEILKLKWHQSDRGNNGNRQQIYKNYIIYTKVRFGKRGKCMQTSSPEKQAKCLYIPKFNLVNIIAAYLTEKYRKTGKT